MVKTIKNIQGVSLIEFLVSFVILVLVTGGILFSYIRCMEFIELSKNMSIAVQAAQSRMDQIKATNYSLVSSSFNGISFAIPNLNGIGVTYIDNSVADLLDVNVVICWRNKNDRLYGEDGNLNGVLDVGEDLNVNLRLDSPVELHTRIFQRL
ncbi:MAG: hypothetical protein AB1650_06945 [Candidatus Omnitrophota bacterium]